MNLYLGDCLDVMRTLPNEYVDSVVTDPPYGLKFMGKHWDHRVPSVEVWAEALRVLKPGGYLLSFGGTRTYHRAACAIEDGGFEIRDQIGWVFGSGFPKSHNGPWGGTALKPAWEPICVARKPLIGTVEQNWKEHGTGALNIDGCRVGYCGTEDAAAAAAAAAEIRGRQTARNTDGWGMGAQTLDRETYLQGPAGKGRWPANLIHDGSDEVLAAFPLAAGQLVDASTTAPSEKTAGIYGAMRRERGNEPSTNSENDGARRCDAGSAARFFYCAKASRRDRNDGVEHLTSGTHSPGTFQAEGTDRSSPNNHPTVKPTDLMRYLCRLVTPVGGVVLDPFMGSGSTGRGSVLEGFDFIGIEREEPYFRIAKSRIEAAMPIPEWLK